MLPSITGRWTSILLVPFPANWLTSWGFCFVAASVTVKTSVLCFGAFEILDGCGIFVMPRSAKMFRSRRTLIILCKLECFIGISTTKKNRITARENHEHFSRVFEIANQLLTCRSLYLGPWMNGNAFTFWNVNEVGFLSVRCLHNKLNHTWFLGDMEFLFAEISSWTLQEIFRISAHPCIILYILLQSVTSNLSICYDLIRYVIWISTSRKTDIKFESWQHVAWLRRSQVN